MHDPTGEVYGMLKVLGYSGRKYKNGDRYVTVRCDCGTRKEMTYPSVRRDTGNRSCGCRRWQPKHGMVGTPEYRCWQAMLARCYCETNKAYANYGAKGITVCKRWHSFEAFFQDMGPSRGLVIDRRNNAKGYMKSNCRWVTRADSNRNMGTNLIVLVDGEAMCFAEAVRRFSSAKYRTAHWRIQSGWDIQKALETTHPNIKFKGK